MKAAGFAALWRKTSLGFCFNPHQLFQQFGEPDWFSIASFDQALLNDVDWPYPLPITLLSACKRSKKRLARTVWTKHSTPPNPQ
jgi:hypothetical protein